MELSLFSKYQEFTPSENKVNKRALIIQQFVDEINKERPYTYEDKKGKKVKVGLITPRAVAVKLGHIKDEFTLTYFLSECRDARNRNRSFSQKFFGALMPLEKLA